LYLCVLRVRRGSNGPIDGYPCRLNSTSTPPRCSITWPVNVHAGDTFVVGYGPLGAIALSFA
jgi:hypothetical protein